MEYWFLLAAAAVSFVGALFHGVVGGRIYMGNINASSLEPLTRSLSLVSWHMFTIFLAVGAAALVYVAYVPAASLLAYPIIVINGFGALMFIGLGVGAHGQLLKMPGAYLMGATAVLGSLGVS
ncbi:MAG: hypothetical protein ABJK20_01010 [Halieaceae bacterium]